MGRIYSERIVSFCLNSKRWTLTIRGKTWRSQGTGFMRWASEWGRVYEWHESIVPTRMELALFWSLIRRGSRIVVSEASWNHGLGTGEGGGAGEYVSNTDLFRALWEQKEKHALPRRVQLMRLESSVKHLCLVGFRGIEQQRLRGIPLTLDLGGFSQSPVLLSGEGDLSAWIRVRSRYMLRLGMTEAFRRKREYLMKETRCDELHTTWRVQSPGQDVQQYK